MVVFYTGSLTTYIPIPFFYLLGPSLMAARTGFIIFAAVGLVTIYYCIRVWLGKAAAFFATILRPFSMRSEPEEKMKEQSSFIFSGSARL